MDDIIELAVENNKESWDDYASGRAELLQSISTLDYEDEFLTILDADV